MEYHKSEERAEGRSGSGSDIREYQGKGIPRQLSNDKIRIHNFSCMAHSLLQYKRSHTRCNTSVQWRDLSIQQNLRTEVQKFLRANGSHGSVRSRSIPLAKIFSCFRTLDGSLLLVVQLGDNFDSLSDIV